MYIIYEMYNYGNISALQTVGERQTDLAEGLGSSARSKVGGFYVSMDACGRDRHIDLRFVISRSGGLKWSRDRWRRWRGRRGGCGRSSRRGGRRGWRRGHRQLDDQPS